METGGHRGQGSAPGLASATPDPRQEQRTRAEAGAPGPGALRDRSFLLYLYLMGFLVSAGAGSQVQTPNPVMDALSESSEEEVGGGVVRFSQGLQGGERGLLGRLGRAQLCSDCSGGARAFQQARFGKSLLMTLTWTELGTLSLRFMVDWND